MVRHLTLILQRDIKKKPKPPKINKPLVLDSYSRKILKPSRRIPSSERWQYRTIRYEFGG